MSDWTDNSSYFCFRYIFLYIYFFLFCGLDSISYSGRHISLIYKFLFSSHTEFTKHWSFGNEILPCKAWGTGKVPGHAHTLELKCWCKRE